MPDRITTAGWKHVHMYLPKPQKQCDCHINDPPPWTGEVHGLSQALMSKTLRMRIFWWIVIIICISLGAFTTLLIIIEYIQGPTATSTTIRLVNSLEFPAITICPKVPDSFNISGIRGDIKESLPDISNETADDLLEYFVAGSGLENMNDVTYFNRTYLSHLNNYYKIWSEGYSVDGFFEIIQQKYGYKCQDLFYECQLAGKVLDCCNDLMVRRVVMRRGICYQTRRDVNQSEADDIGRIVFSLKAPSSYTSVKNDYKQTQLIVYVTDNHNVVTEFPRFYLYPNEWNRMRFTARLIELIQNKGVCTNHIFGRDAECMVRKWYLSNIIIPFNCTLPYLKSITKLPPTTGVCKPDVIADNYLDKIQYVWNSAEVNEEYEYVKEVYTTSIPGFMSQIGGQFGFFLGLSIITLIQMVLYGFHSAFMFAKKHIQKKFPFCKIHPSDDYTRPPIVMDHSTNIYPPEKNISKEHIATLSRRVIATTPPSPVSTVIDSVDLPPHWGLRNIDRERENPLYGNNINKK
ncbi:CBN-TAG-263 protein [Caenorhabditis brenneri]|uniref:CBN-TAG-263 protein n=1 Tax=Caenorhabditis brenneri TaxID=135651 RepID=G0MH06_CAEBE|nr:CBN-TAG-263 protein [Caenorhabditis brenneri]